MRRPTPALSIASAFFALLAAIVPMPPAARPQPADPQQAQPGVASAAQAPSPGNAEAHAPHADARVVVRLTIEAPRQCPSNNLRAYTYIYIEGSGTPDEDGYINVTARATTDIFIMSGRVVSLVPRHHEMTYPLAMRLDRFPPVPIPGMPTMFSLDYPTLPTEPGSPDVECTYIEDDGSLATSTGSEELAFRVLINTIKAALYGLDGMQQNAEGMYGVEGVYLGPNNTIYRIVAEWWPDKAVPGMDVTPDARGIFIGGVPIDIFYDYASAWDDDGSLNGTMSIKHGRSGWEKVTQPAPNTVRKTINPGSAVGQSTQMEGQVVLNNGNGSTPVKKPYESTPRLSVFKPDNVDPSKVNEEVAYKFERAMPNPAWEADYKFPTSFPAPLKGKEFKAKAQMKFLFETSSLQAPTTIKAGIGGEGEVTVGKISGKLAPEGMAEFNYSKAGFEFVKGTGKVDFQIGYKDTYGPFDLVPTLKPAVSAIGLDEWLEKYLSIEVGLYAITVGNIEVFKGADGMDWKAKVQPGMRVTAKGIAGNEEANFGAEVEAKGEGRLNLFINDPPNPFFGGADGEVTFTASFVFFNNKASYENKITFAIGNQMSAGRTVASDARMGLATEGYTYGSTWTAPSRLRPGAANDTTTVLLTKASPLAAPSMDSTGRAACWVTQRAGVPASRNMEIACATGAAPVFGQPVTLTNDTFADALPSVALAGPNAPVVAWWRHTDPALPVSTTLDAAYLRQTNVMVSAYDPVSGAWSPAVSFGAANSADYAPQIAGNGTNRALLVWRENAAGQVGGFAATPDIVKAAVYDPGAKTWGATQSLTAPVGLLDVQPAVGPAEAAVAYAIDADGVASTTHDLEIWAQRQIAGAWQAPTRLTNNADADSSPKLAYDAAGQPVIAWLRNTLSGEKSVMLQRGWAGVPSAAAFDGVYAPFALRDMAVNADGDVALTWPIVVDGQDVQSELAYAVFDAGAGAWSAPMRLTRDPNIEQSANLAWRNATELSVLYDRVALQTLTSTVVISGVATPFTYTTPNPNGHDLVVLTHPIAPAQPEVPVGGLTINPANAAPGATAVITAVVRNLGDVPVTGAQVKIGASDARLPALGAPTTTVATATLPMLRGGETRRVSFTVSLPARPNRLAAALTCPACPPAPGAIITTTLADLAMLGAGPDRASVPGTTFVRADIVNSGVISAARADMTVEDDSGVLGAVTVYITPTTGLLPGESARGYFPLDASTEFTGPRPITVTVQLIDPAGEAIVANNVASFDWIRLPDWSLTNGGLVLGAPGPGGTPITITAYNQSDVTAPEALVQVFSMPPDEGGVLLWQGALGSAEPFGRARRVAVLPGAVPRAFARVNLPEAFEELSTANNTARAGRGFADVARILTYMPLIRR